MAYANGRYPTSALRKVQDAGDGYKTEYLRKDAADNYLRMVADAKRNGLTIKLNDGYRSYSEQVYLAQKYGLYSNGGLAAYPGTSNHGHGIAIDVANIGSAREWIARNGHRYGFSGPLAREPWHFDCSKPGLTFRVAQECPFDTLNYGDRGGDVRFLEARLAMNIDGLYDRPLRSRVIEFQRDKNLTADGVVGPSTWLKLLKGSYRIPTLNQGDGDTGTRRGMFVLMLKRRLRDLGYTGFIMNPNFGLGTKRAVRKFQRKHNMTADGVAGPRTWRRLFW